MTKLLRERSQKAGLPPGTLVHIGDKKRESTSVTVINYNEENIYEKEQDIENDAFLLDDSYITWINIEGLHDITVLESIKDKFNLHPLVMEDVLSTEQRPKVEDYVDYIYVVAKTLSYSDKQNDINKEQVSLILGKNFVISFLESDSNLFDPIRERLKSNIGRIRRMDADYLLYTIVDAIVDSYFLVLEKMGDRIERVEDIILKKPTQDTMHMIHRLKREAFFLNKAIWPLREVIGALEKGETHLIKESTNVYLRDVYDHTVQLMDTIETFRDILSSTLDIYLSNSSNKMNEVMKVLTIISTVFIPLTFIVGVYGMNFSNMPELNSKWGYPMVWAFMVSISILMIIYFKRKKWI